MYAFLLIILFHLAAQSTAEIITLPISLVAPAESLIDEDPCNLIYNSDLTAWSSRTLRDCEYLYQETLGVDGTVIYYKIDVDTWTLPNQADLENYNFFSWTVNRLLNKGSQSCSTAVGKGQSEDSYLLPNFVADRLYRDVFILTGPYKEDLCDYITGTQFIENQFEINNCTFEDKNEIQVDNQKIVKYTLQVTERNDRMQPFAYAPEIFILFLKVLNTRYSGCYYNGYWAPPRFESAAAVTVKIKTLPISVIAPPESVIGDNPCDVLVQKSSVKWSDGTFSSCEYLNQQDLDVEGTVLNFEIDVDTMKLPNQAVVENYDWMSWTVNYLSGDISQSCLTAVGEGQDKDAYEIPPVITDHLFRDVFILTGPLKERFCDSIINTQYIDTQFEIYDCQLSDEDGFVLDGEQIVKYRLNIVERNDRVQSFAHAPEIYIFFLEELNKQHGGCYFNGYWAPARFPPPGIIEPLKKKLPISVIAPPEYTVGNNPCEIIIEKASEQWSDGTFSACEYMREEDLDVDGKVLHYEIHVDVSNLPNQDDIWNYGSLSWVVNYLAGGRSQPCLTAVGVGQPEDSYPVQYQLADYLYRDEFVLLGPKSETLCDSITGSQYIDDQFEIRNCTIREDGHEFEFDGQLIVKYNLQVTERNHRFRPYSYAPQIYILFLEALNNQYGKCYFDGYWATPNFGFP